MVFVTIFGTEFLKTLAFPEESSKGVSGYVNKVTVGPPPEDGSWLPGEPTFDSSVETLSPTPELWGRARAWKLTQLPKANDLINQG